MEGEVNLLGETSRDDDGDFGGSQENKEKNGMKEKMQ